ncbi:MAG: Na+/H+ antiporter NhaA [Bradymonadia bacterium]|jgi:NhaA family Na+:H+ antiporter
MKKLWNIVMDNTLLLIIGAAIGLVWANIDLSAYHHLIDFDFEALRNPWFGIEQDDGSKHLTFHFLVNDIFMAFFFAMAGKEVWESTFPGGALHNPKNAATPLITTAGGVVGPALFYIVGAFLIGKWGELHHGWAVPTATDIAFSAMFARIIFGNKHPAIPFLLLLAIADDAIGMVIIAIFFTKGAVVPLWLLLSLAAALFGYFVFNKKLKINSYWPYLILFVISWAAFGLAGIHTSLSFIPIVVIMPHAETDAGIHAAEELSRTDTLNRFGAAFNVPVHFVLFLFGLANAGVAFTEVGYATWIVLASLMIGKPLGIFLFGGAAVKIFKLGFPKFMGYRDLFVLGSVAGIGFTVALFMASVAYPAGPIQDAAKLGALFSLGSAVASFVLSKMLGVKRMDTLPDEEEELVVATEVASQTAE